MKKLLSSISVVFLLCFILVGSITSVFAEEMSLEEMKANLISKGLPENYLPLLNEKHIEKLYQDGLRYAISYSEELKFINETNENSKGNRN